MPSEFPRRPKIIKGALIKLSEEFLGPVPNIILFQFNPEKISRTISGLESKMGKKRSGEQTSAQPEDPGEKLSFSLEFDAADMLDEPETHPVAVISGVADRIAALELLLYPAGTGDIGQLATFSTGQGKTLPRKSVPIVLFVWGSGRIVPVRLTEFRVEEEAYSTTLYPIKATVTVTLQILTEKALTDIGRNKSTGEKLAIEAYKYTIAQKELLAKANLANSAESILGMIPFL